MKTLYAILIAVSLTASLLAGWWFGRHQTGEWIMPVAPGGYVPRAEYNRLWKQYGDVLDRDLSGFEEMDKDSTKLLNDYNKLVGEYNGLLASYKDVVIAAEGLDRENRALGSAPVYVLQPGYAQEPEPRTLDVYHHYQTEVESEPSTSYTPVFPPPRIKPPVRVEGDPLQEYERNSFSGPCSNAAFPKLCEETYGRRGSDVSGACGNAAYPKLCEQNLLDGRKRK
jgi:hypothetical protein